MATGGFSIGGTGVGTADAGITSGVSGGATTGGRGRLGTAGSAGNGAGAAVTGSGTIGKSVLAPKREAIVCDHSHRGKPRGRDQAI